MPTLPGSLLEPISNSPEQDGHGGELHEAHKVLRIELPRHRAHRLLNVSNERSLLVIMRTLL